jgi:hypothetical protein
MSRAGVRSSLLSFFVKFFAAFVLLLGLICSGVFPPRALGQEPERKTIYSSFQKSGTGSDTSGEERNGVRAYLRDRLHWNWNQRGRSVPPGESAAGLRSRAYRQKMAMRAARAAATPPPKQSLDGAPTTSPPQKSLGGVPASATGWTPLGPAPLASDATGDGGQDYNWVSGRATSVLIDPADNSGNTVFLGGAYGGLWKSTNAGSLSSSPASVTWQALIDDQPTLAVGAIALQPGNSSVILVGTGEANGSSDSYYGLGILRSTDGGATWTQNTGKGQPPDQSFLGIGFSKIAFSTANPTLVVAAAAGDNGLCLGEEAATAGNTGPCLGPQEDGNSPGRGLYYSTNGGVTWNRATLTDGSVAASATSVIYNPLQGTNGTFYAFIRRHGLYSSTNGINFTPLATLPIPGLTSANCPATSNATTCTIYRGEFAMVPGRNEIYVWIVDVQPDASGNPVPVDEGIWKTTNGGTSWTEIPDNGITNCGDSAFGPNSGCGVEQGWFNLELAAIPNATGTDVYAGAINLYKCTLEGGTTCTQGDWINLTHVYGCSPLGAPAHVHPDQHGIAFMVASDKTAPGYFAHDGGISRTLDGYSGLNDGSCSGTNQFDSLSQTLGSMTEFVSVSVHPTSADILLGGTQGNGSPKTSSATENSTWQNALGGDGGFTAINPANPSEWFAANPYVTIMKCEAGTACNDNTFFQVVGSSDLGGDQGAFNTPYILDPQNASEMLVGTCRVWQISTSGSAPLQLSNDFDTLGMGVCTGDEINLVDALAAGGPAPNNYSAVVYAVTDGYGPLSGAPNGEVWVTTNAGVSLMTNVTGSVNPNGYAISTVAMDSSDATGNTAYVGIMGFSTPTYPTSHVWKTANAGASWMDWTGTGLPGALPDNPVNALLVDSSVTPPEIYAGTDVGVFASSTMTASWTEVGPAPGTGASGFLPNAPVTALQLFSYEGTKTLVASTYGRGIWTYALTIAPSYTNVISNSPQTVFPTQTATFDGTLTAQNGYASAVNLSCTGAAPATCTPTPAQVNFSGNTATYTLTAGGSAGDYSFNAHAAGTDGNAITRDAPVTLHVVDFNLTAPSPNSLSVGQGGTSGASTFQVTAAGSFAGAVALSCPSGLPPGAACVFSPSSLVSPTSSSPVTVTLSVTAAGTPVGGPTTVTIAAMTTGAPAAKTQTFSLTVTGPAADFTWTDTGSASVTVLAGQSATYTFSAAPAGGGTFGSAVSFACTGLPALTSCGFSPASIAAGAGTTAVTLTIATTGPNAEAQSRPRRGAVHLYALPFFTLGWVVVMGIVGIGRQRRGKPRLYSRIAAICLGLGLMAEISCGGVGGGGSTTPPVVTVTVSPGSETLFANEAGNSWPAGVTQQQFTATVNNSTNQSVTWAVTGGNANGTVDGTGLYTTPAVLPNPATVTVTATSAAATSPGSATVTVQAATVVGTSQITVTATAAGEAAHADGVSLVVQ